MATPSIQTERYHSLDALRAVMMSLGLVLHHGLAFHSPPVLKW